MYKVTGKDLGTHSCREDLYNAATTARHSYENCPTHNLKQHPEAKERIDNAKKEEKKKAKEQKRAAKEVFSNLTS